MILLLMFWYNTDTCHRVLTVIASIIEPWWTVSRYTSLRPSEIVTRSDGKTTCMRRRISPSPEGDRVFYLLLFGLFVWIKITIVTRCHRSPGVNKTPGVMRAVGRWKCSRNLLMLWRMHMYRLNSLFCKERFAKKQIFGPCWTNESKCFQSHG